MVKPELKAQWDIIRRLVCEGEQATSDPLVARALLYSREMFSDDSLRRIATECMLCGWDFARTCEAVRVPLGKGFADFKKWADKHRAKYVQPKKN
jgi:hypothetical protein